VITAVDTAATVSWKVCRARLPATAQIVGCRAQSGLGKRAIVGR
jgi:hypothetical protein